MEELPEPKVNVQQPMFGVFLEGVPFEFDWNATITKWDLDQSRPGGNDQIESVSYYVETDGDSKELYSESVNLDPDDLPENFSLTVNPAELAENLETGEVKDIEDFYVVLETRKQGEIEYPRGDETAVKANVSVINMPTWLWTTHAITEIPKDKMVTAIHESSGEVVPKDLIDKFIVKKENELYIDFTGELSEARDSPIALLNDVVPTADYTVMGGLRFRPYSPPNKASANYEFGYRMNLGGQSFPAGDKILQKTGLTSVGMPMMNLEGSLDGTAYGEIQEFGKTPPLPEYESDSEVSVGGGAFVSADERVIPFAPPVSGAVRFGFEESGNADLPRGSTDYTASVDGEGNITTSLDRLSFQTAKGIPVNVGVDALFKFKGEVDGKSPGLASSENPVLLAGGNNRVWENSGNLTLGFGISADAGWPGLLSVGQRIGIKGNMTEFRMAKPVFSKFKGRFTLDHKVSVLTIGGRKNWAEFLPFQIRYIEGSNSTLVLTEVQQGEFTVDRYWTQANGYDSIQDWSGEGTVVEKAHPHANPRIAVDEDGLVHLVAGHDRASLPVAEGLELRYFNGSADSLDTKGASFTGMNGTFTPAIAAGNGTQWAGLANFEEYNDIPADIVSSEIYYASRSGGEWSEPIRITENGYTESYVRIDSCGPNTAALLWNADETSLETVDDIGLRYAVVNTTGVIREPTTVESEGVRGSASIACHGESGEVTVAYPVSRTTNSPDPRTLTNPNAAVVTRYATSEGISDAKEVGTGTTTEVIETGKDTALVTYIDGTQGRVGYGKIDNGSLLNRGTVSQALASEISITEGSGKDKILAWTVGTGTRDDATVEYATYNGTGWDSPKAVAKGMEANRTSLSIALDEESETIYMVSMESASSTPILDGRTVNVSVDTVEPGDVQVPSDVEVSGVTPDDPVLEGEVLEINVTVENTGGQSAEPDFILEVEGNQSDKIENVTVPSNVQVLRTLSYTTDTDDPPSINVTGIETTEGTNATETATVLRKASFEVNITSTNSPVVEGENVTVNATITNIGDTKATQTVNLTDTNDVFDSRTVTLDGGNSTEFNLTWQTKDGDAGESNLTVSSDEDVASTNVTVEQDALFREELKIAGASSPPRNIPESQGGFDNEKFEDLDGDGDFTDTGATVRAFGKLLRDESLVTSGSLTDEQARALNWNPFSPETELRPSDMVTLFGKQLRAG